MMTVPILLVTARTLREMQESRNLLLGNFMKTLEPTSDERLYTQGPESLSLRQTNEATHEENYFRRVIVIKSTGPDYHVPPYAKPMQLLGDTNDALRRSK
ncbi:hypothetical protein H2248_003425 [Termitomyces sp. 'cryptogamus']|nr:hypothetical protein H2248_003425 [Termitomyces sp. 'cryptogamus']